MEEGTASGMEGSKPLQVKLPGFEYTTVLQVPSSRNSRLFREIAKIEPRLTKMTGYQVKLVEKSGRSLAKMLSPNMSPPKCHRSDCLPCQNPEVIPCAVLKMLYMKVSAKSAMMP